METSDGTAPTGTTGPHQGELPALVESMPFATVIGMELTSASADEVRAVLRWRPDLTTVANAMHGGAVMAFADSLGGICAYLNLTPGEATSTIESKTNFFRALRTGRLQAVSRPLHVGRTTIVVETDLFDDDGRRVARTTQTQARINRQNPGV